MNQTLSKLKFLWQVWFVSTTLKDCRLGVELRRLIFEKYKRTYDVSFARRDIWGKTHVWISLHFGCVMMTLGVVKYHVELFGARFVSYERSAIDGEIRTDCYILEHLATSKSSKNKCSHLMFMIFRFVHFWHLLQRQKVVYHRGRL